MTVEEARKKGVCRICEGPMWKDAVKRIATEDLAFRYGEEYAHERCVEQERLTKEEQNANSTEDHATEDPDLQVT